MRGARMEVRRGRAWVGSKVDWSSALRRSAQTVGMIVFMSVLRQKMIMFHTVGVCMGGDSMCAPIPRRPT